MAVAINLEVCNLSLDFIGANTISTITESTREARLCTRNYPLALDTVLSAADWGFAHKEVALALTTEVFEGWDYCYSWPSDCVVFRGIYNELEETADYASASQGIKTPYKRVSNAAGSKQYILTNQEDAVGVITKRVSDSNMWDAVFKEALMLKLAALLAQPLRGNSDKLKNAMTLYQSAIAQAMAIDASMRHKQPTNDSRYLRVRE